MSIAIVNSNGVPVITSTTTRVLQLKPSDIVTLKTFTTKKEVRDFFRTNFPTKPQREVATEICTIANISDLIREINAYQ